MTCGMLNHKLCCWSSDLIVAYQCHNGWHEGHNGVRDVMTVTTMVSPAPPLIGHCPPSPASDWLRLVTTPMSHTYHEAHVSQSAPLQRFLTAWVSMEPHIPLSPGAWLAHTPSLVRTSPPRALIGCWYSSHYEERFTNNHRSDLDLLCPTVTDLD